VVAASPRQPDVAAYRSAQAEQTVLVDVWLIDALGQEHTDSVTFIAPGVAPPPPPDPLPPPDPGGNDTITINDSIPSNVSI